MQSLYLAMVNSGHSLWHTLWKAFGVGESETSQDLAQHLSSSLAMISPFNFQNSVVATSFLFRSVKENFLIVTDK